MITPEDIIKIANEIHIMKYGYPFFDEEARGNPQYYTWKRSALKRSNYQCQKCLAKDKPLHVHHIKSWKKYPKLRHNSDNAQVLCIECHKKIHRKKI